MYFCSTKGQTSGGNVFDVNDLAYSGKDIHYVTEYFCNSYVATYFLFINSYVSKQEIVRKLVLQDYQENNLFVK